MFWNLGAYEDEEFSWTEDTMLATLFKRGRVYFPSTSNPSSPTSRFSPHSIHRPIQPDRRTESPEAYLQHLYCLSDPCPRLLLPVFNAPQLRLEAQIGLGVFESEDEVLCDGAVQISASLAEGERRAGVEEVDGV